MKSRGFERIIGCEEGVIPVRATAKSAGYDFSTIEQVEINPSETKLVKTGIKAYMMSDEVLKIYVRSSLGFKKNLRLDIIFLVDYRFQKLTHLWPYPNRLREQSC